MGKGGGKPKMPVEPDPVPTPEEVDEDVKRKSQAERRRRLFSSGRGGTILTQAMDLGEARTAKATLLGTSTATGE